MGREPSGPLIEYPRHRFRPPRLSNSWLGKRSVPIGLLPRGVRGVQWAGRCERAARAGGAY